MKIVTFWISDISNILLYYRLMEIRIPCRKNIAIKQIATIGNDCIVFALFLK